MAKDGKFGMFGGVFTPSILTILGVIMYLRLPWVVGNSGLYLALGVILVAHAVSLSTGLSISSIATDKKVGAGGPYYIISRSFGLPIGGAIGLALFLGLSFSISLYVIGFCESFLSYIDVAPSKTNIRIAGTATIILLTTITFISTSLAIKTQFFILIAIVASLFAIFLSGLNGDFGPDAVAPAADAAKAAAAKAAEAKDGGGGGGGASFAVLFGIFFPAVTGFTAGVNMSGDLRDPKSAIPKGTMLAIIVGMVVYLVLGWFLATRVDAEALRNNPEILQDIALWAPLVVAGIWGATLSSALGSILGAPRILQAMSLDRITPRVFARGFGPTLEPRNALFLAFAIGEAGILIAELNAIARIVSMVFLAMYGSVNIACAIEAWASPDFRPKFRIPNIIPILGAGACILLMIQLDVLYSAGALLLMLLAFVVLSRRQLSLEAGDTWEGVWASLVRVGLQRLHRSEGQQRNWRPNMLMFDDHEHPRHTHMKEFSMSLVTGNGMVTDFALADNKRGPRDTTLSDEENAGYFERTLVTNDRFESIRSLVQHHGFSGIQPNTLLLPWRWQSEASEDYLEALKVAAENDLNLLLFEEAHRDIDRTKVKPRIDVWWWSDNGNLALSVSLVRFLTRSPAWEDAGVRVLIVGSGIEDEDQLLRAKAMRHLEQSRVEANVRVIPPPVGTTAHHTLVTDTSKDAALCIVGLPVDLGSADVDTLDGLEKISGLAGGVVVLRANKAFPRVLGTALRQERDQRAALETEEIETLELPVPDHREVSTAANLIYDNMRVRLKRWHERGVTRIYERHLDLCEKVRNLAEQRYDAMLKAAEESNPPRRRARANRATSTFLVEAEKCLSEFLKNDLSAQGTLLEEELTALMTRDVMLPEGMPQILDIKIDRSEFKAHEDDPPALRRWKRRQRWRRFYRKKLRQAVPLGQLARYYHAEVIHTFVVQTVHRFEHDSHELIVELSRLLTVAERRAHTHLNRSVTAAASDFDVVEHLQKTRDTTLNKIDELRDHTLEHIDLHRGRVLRRHLKICGRLGEDLSRLDAGPFIARERKRNRDGIDAMMGLNGSTEVWHERQAALVARARMAVTIGSFRHQLTVAAIRALEQLSAGVRTSALQVCSQLRTELIKRRDNPTDTGDAPVVPREPNYDGSPVAIQLARAVAPMTAELPAVETTLSDETVLRLSQGELETIEHVTLSVRSGIQTLVETDLITRVEAEAGRIAELQSHAWVVARDTIRLLAAQAPDEESAGEDEDAEDDRISSTLSYSIERIEAEVERLNEFLTNLDTTVSTALERLSSATSVLTLTGSLSGAGKKAQSRRASRVVAFVRGIGARARDLAARAIYRRSVARAHTGGGAQQVRELVHKAQGDAKVLGELPRYYQHLFLGALNINEAFFIGRERELESGIEALANPDHVGQRVVLVSGDRGAGKTTLCQQIATATKSQSIWVSPPLGGSASAEAFRNALAAAIGERGTPEQLLAGLDQGSVVVIDDIDLWWERRPGGLAGIDEMIRVIREATNNVGFVLAGSSHAIRLLDDVRPLSRLATVHLRCEPLAAQQIKDVVMTRHTSTGLRIQLGNTSEDAFTEWSLARLFHAHFEHSKGNVGASLRAWVAHVTDVTDERLHIRRPSNTSWDALGDLRPELTAILVELLLHKHASMDKLQRVTNMGGSELSEALAELRSIGLVIEYRRSVFQMTPQAHTPVTAWLERGSLA